MFRWRKPKKEPIKCSVVGDHETSKKTELLSAYTAVSMSPEEYGPQVFANYPVNQMVGGESHSLWLADTDSREEFDGLRRLGHLHTDVILICFSVVAPSSLEDVRQKWVPEVLRHAREDTPFMLVGTETDLRDDAETVDNLAKNQQRPVTADEGKELAQELGAVAYMECSAKTLEGVNEVFHEALLVGLHTKFWNQLLESDSRRRCILI